MQTPFKTLPMDSSNDVMSMSSLRLAFQFDLGTLFNILFRSCFRFIFFPSLSVMKNHQTLFQCHLRLPSSPSLSLFQSSLYFSHYTFPSFFASQKCFHLIHCTSHHSPCTKQSCRFVPLPCPKLRLFLLCRALVRFSSGIFQFLISLRASSQISKSLAFSVNLLQWQFYFKPGYNFVKMQQKCTKRSRKYGRKLKRFFSKSILL